MFPMTEAKFPVFLLDVNWGPFQLLEGTSFLSMVHFLHPHGQQWWVKSFTGCISLIHSSAFLFHCSSSDDIKPTGQSWVISPSQVLNLSHICKVPFAMKVSITLASGDWDLSNFGEPTKNTVGWIIKRNKPFLSTVFLSWYQMEEIVFYWRPEFSSQTWPFLYGFDPN